MKTRVFSMWLPCDLTEQELLERGRTLSEQLAERARVSFEKATQMRRFTDQLRELDGDISTLTKTIQTQQENRNVMVESRFDPDKRTIDTIRRDTGETVSSRSATDVEKEKGAQQELPIEPPEGF